MGSSPVAVILNLTFVLLLECQNIKIFLPVFVIKKVKNSVPWTYVINYLNEEEIVGTFYEKTLQKKQIKNCSELKK